MKIDKRISTPAVARQGVVAVHFKYRIPPFETVVLRDDELFFISF
jgi:hypothetical protein